MTEQARFFEGKKFMWDGEEYENEKQTSSIEKEYREKGFEVQSYKEEGKVYLYTRRIVTEIVLE